MWHCFSVSLTKTEKRGLERKQNLIDEVRCDVRSMGLWALFVVFIDETIRVSELHDSCDGMYLHADNAKFLAQM